MFGMALGSCLHKKNEIKNPVCAESKEGQHRAGNNQEAVKPVWLEAKPASLTLCNYRRVQRGVTGAKGQ